MGVVRTRRGVALAALVVVATACGPPEQEAARIAPDPTTIIGEPGPALPTFALPPTTTTPATPAAATGTTATSGTGTAGTGTAGTAGAKAAPGTIVEVPYRLERRTSDAATAGFEAMAERALGDPRGWGRAGFRLVRSPTAPFAVVLAEGSEVDRLCLPYETYGLYSCQNGPVVALNADRWRTATPKWTGTLDDYRRYLVGHEVGHLLGLRHPAPQCPAPGRPAPLMAQQSTELDGCLPNPWPLEHEVAMGRTRPADLAPPYRR